VQIACSAGMYHAPASMHLDVGVVVAGEGGARVHHDALELEDLLPAVTAAPARSIGRWRCFAILQV